METEESIVTYVARPDRVNNELRPTGEYLSHLLIAGPDLSVSYYEELKTIHTLD